ncbi:MAG TPA: permease-like cell division protein FtsX [Gammaproteobacteria bacterium]|nr:permease-like cell division protein FtsX [Gammaproteobacteria bacterium]
MRARARKAGAPAGARRRDTRLRGWLLRHAQNLLGTLGTLTRQPVATLMTVAVIGIALALPASLYLLVVNGRALTGGLESAADVSVYLREHVSPAAAAALAEDLRARADVAAVRLIDPAEALEEFERRSGFGAALDTLAVNPLPFTLVVRPAQDTAGPAALAALAEELGALPQAELAQQDTEWVRRLDALLDIVRRTVVLAAIVLALGVIVIVGNTIRLDIQNRRAEIEVTKLIGASDGFIRRPFLYSGFWYGLGGGLFAALLVTAALMTLSGAVGRVAGLYGSSFRLEGLGAGTVVALLGTGALLGWLGSWLAAARHMRRIEPA